MSVKDRLSRKGIQDAISKEAQTISNIEEAKKPDLPVREKRAGRGRPKGDGKNPTINVSLEPEALARFEFYCKEKGFSISGGARAIILEKMRREGF